MTDKQFFNVCRKAHSMLQEVDRASKRGEEPYVKRKVYDQKKGERLLEYHLHISRNDSGHYSFRYEEYPYRGYWSVDELHDVPASDLAMFLDWMRIAAEM